MPEGVLNGGVGTTCDDAADASTGGRVKFNLFLDIFYFFKILFLLIVTQLKYF